MTFLDRIIQDLIAREGPLTVARYMQLALQHPQYGYYVKGDPLGEGGDFTTSPEISQMFGELIGLWIADMWIRAGRPAPFLLLELGPGRGTLMQDALRATERVAGFHEAMHLMLLDTNEKLTAMQREKLASYQPEIVTDLSSLPLMPLFVIANEFFDALPVHQFLKQGDTWYERMVGQEGGQLAFVASRSPISLPFPDNITFYEMSPLSVAMIQTLGAHISAHGGAGLVIDYGYTQFCNVPTLQAVSGHASVPPLQRAGEVDLTAHVDFAALKIAAEKQGCFVPEISRQGAFLLALGISIRADQLKHHNENQPEMVQAIDKALHRLTSDEEMGALFKVMAFTPKGSTEICGF